MEGRGKGGGEEHLVGLDRGTDEKTGEGNGWETETAGEILVRKSLYQSVDVSTSDYLLEDLETIVIRAANGLTFE